MLGLKRAPSPSAAHRRLVKLLTEYIDAFGLNDVLIAAIKAQERAFGRKARGRPGRARRKGVRRGAR